MYMLNMVIILIIMYCNVVTAIDKIPTYLLRFNITLQNNLLFYYFRRNASRSARKPIHFRQYMYTKKKRCHNHTKVHWPALLSDVLQIWRASLGRLTRAWLALWSSTNLKYILACKKTLRLSINLLECTERTLECAECTLECAERTLECAERTLECADRAADPPELCLCMVSELKFAIGDDIPVPVVGYGRSPRSIWERSVWICLHMASMICCIRCISRQSSATCTSTGVGTSGQGGAVGSSTCGIKANRKMYIKRK